MATSVLPAPTRRFAMSESSRATRRVTQRTQRGALAIPAPAAHAVPRFFTRLFAKRAAKPGEHFGAPGQGSSAVIATSTVAVLLLLWVVVSNSGLVKPIFLPTPQAVFAKFIQVATEGFAGATLLEHTATSLGR